MSALGAGQGASARPEAGARLAVSLADSPGSLAP